MKGTKNHKNTSTFSDLFFEISSLSLSKTDRRTVFFDKLNTVFFSEPITDLMSDIDTDSSDSDESIDVMFSEEASDDNDYVLTRKDHPNNW